MSPKGTLALLLCLLAGCGGDDGASKAPSQGDDPALTVAGEWIQALNDRDWAAACDRSVVPAGFPCQQFLAKAFAGYDGTVAMQGAYLDKGKSEAHQGQVMAFSLAEAPPGFSAGGVERLGDRLLVHWEAQLVE